MGTVITCGVYGFTAEAFEAAIVNAQPDVFVDVRRRRGVRGKQYSFANSKHLQDTLEKHGITYIHRIDLAPSDSLVKLEGEIDKARHIARHDRVRLSEEFINTYQNEVMKDFDARAFIESLGDVDRVLLLCVEATPDACHRGLLAGAIVDQLGWNREDIIGQE